MKKGNIESISHINKLQYCLIGILLVFVLLIRFFPAHSSVDDPISLTDVHVERQITLIDITRQEMQVQQPARPQVRLDERFTDMDIVDPEFDMITMFVADVGDLMPLPVGSSSGEIVSNPDRSPRVTRIVEPVTPGGVIQSGKRFRVKVRFLVDENGHVEEIFITDILEFDSFIQDYIAVNRSEPEIAEATMAAAIQWRFRPAIENGEPVRSFSNHLFTFGR